MRGLEHIAVRVAESIIVAEFFGYLLHRLMHTGLIPWMSVSHMKHHMLLYGPLQKQRPSEKYLDATTGQIAIGNIGLEWIVPSGVILAISVAVLRLLRVSFTDQALSIATILVWSSLMFSYLHDRMHIKDFWMGRAPLLSPWFLRARRLHDIHHHVLNSEGIMDKNFGIGFFVFDRLFGTLAYEGSAFNRPGHAVAQRKFRVLYGHKMRQCPLALSQEVTSSRIGFDLGLKTIAKEKSHET
jgi:sterol desaturase/sphingolipid hydroxylase (fatty acid hydroxylase superfamily)